MTEQSAPARRAVLHTNHGDITVDLFPDHAPKTVANFADLAEGRRQWTHPQTRQKTTTAASSGGKSPSGRGSSRTWASFSSEIPALRPSTTWVGV